MNKNKLVSVLVGSRNRVDALSRCLQGIVSQDYTNLEVLVLDDCSDEDLRGALKERIKDRRIRWFRSDRQLGIAGGRNFLMRRAGGLFFVGMDDDAVFADKGCLSRAVDIMKTYSNIGLLAFKIVDHSAKGDRLIVPFSKLELALKPWLVDNFGLVSYFLGGGYLMRREVMENGVSYYEDLVWGNEEIDFSYNVVNHGFSIGYTPDVIVHHYPQVSAVGRRKSRSSELYYRTRNRIWIGLKYLPLPYLFVYTFVWLVRYFIQALLARDISGFLHGVRDGVGALSKFGENRLSSDAVSYLRENHGRLWY